MGTVSADPGIIYVNNTGGNDTWDGQSSVYDNVTGSGPKLSIKNATGTVTTNGVVNIADGVYAGEGNTNININQNMTIIGQSQDGTIINAQNTSTIFIIQSGVFVTLKNLTLANGTAENGGTIYSDGTLTISNDTFTGNYATRGAGIYSTGLLNVTDSLFTNNYVTYNGASIYSTGTAYVTNCTFINNSAVGWGAGIYSNGGTTTVNGSTFIGNAAEYGGAILNKIGTVYVNGSTFINNTASSGGSAICNAGDYSVTSVNFCTITGNNNVAIFNKKSGSFNAENNWWGTNFDGTNPVSAGMSNAPVSTWLVANVTASPQVISATGKSTITVDVTHDNHGNDTSSQGHIPDGIPVTFETTLGNITNGATVNGRSQVNLNGNGNSGVANVTAIIDQQSGSTVVTLGLSTVYVSPTGNDVTGDGSQANPYQTIKQALSVLNNNGIVILSSGIYNLTGDYNIAFTENATITGTDQINTIIDAGKLGTIFVIPSNVIVNLENLTLINGKNTNGGGAIVNSGTVALTNCNLTGNIATSSSTGGGAIYNTGTVTINNSTVNQNTATTGNGGAIYNSGTLNINSSTFNSNRAGNGGGAVDNYNYNNVTVINSFFSGNSCGTRHGGAIDNWKDVSSVGNVIVTGCTFIANSATQSGGAFNVDDGCTATVTNCTFTNNTAERAGAVSIWDSSSVNITDCTFTGNSVASTSRGYGGAINSHNYSTAIITNCTFVNNTAAINGGAVSNFKGTMTITGCTFIGNSAVTGGAIDNDPNSVLTVKNSTFTANRATTGGVIENYDSSTLNMTGCTFVNNTATSKSGVIDNTATLIANYNTFNGNTAPTGNAISNNGGSADVRYNWWGSNSPNFTSLISGTANYSPWIYMTISADPTTVNRTQSSVSTVSFNNLFNGTTVTAFDPALGHIPDGSLVNFQTDLGTLGTNINSTLNGITNTLFTAGETAGTAHISATTNNQTIYTLVTINSQQFTVDSGMGNAQIQSIIDSALPGDIITFQDGYYSSTSLTITKILHLVTSGATLINDGTSSVITFMGANASGSSISGFTINGASNVYCICLNAVNSVNVTNNIINWGMVGIDLWNSQNNTISGNQVTGNAWSGICLDTSNGNTITGNVVSTNQEGIFLSNSSHNTIYNNTVVSNTYTGLTTLNGGLNSIQGNNIQSNGVSGILVQRSAGNVVSGNTVQSNGWSGICLDQATGTDIAFNIVTSNQEGIFAANNATGNTIRNNTVANNTYTGVSILSGSGNNVISGNSVSGNGFNGILVQNSNQNTFQYNTVSNNGWSGLCFDQSVNNNINRNNIENNPEQAYDNRTNSYDDGSTGNYWSDWSSSDPRPIDGGSNVDNHPSATPF